MISARQKGPQRTRDAAGPHQTAARVRGCSISAPRACGTPPVSWSRRGPSRGELGSRDTRSYLQCMKPPALVRRRRSVRDQNHGVRNLPGRGGEARPLEKQSQPREPARGGREPAPRAAGADDRGQAKGAGPGTGKGFFCMCKCARAPVLRGGRGTGETYCCRVPAPHVSRSTGGAV